MNQNNFNNLTYVLKINLNDVNNIDYLIKNTINTININDNIISSNNNDDTTDIVIMTKDEYTNYILNNNGTIINNNNETNYNCVNIDSECSICKNNLYLSLDKIYKLNLCSHIFHYKCINKWFKTVSNKFNDLHTCPLCRSSNEYYIDNSM